MAAGRFTVEPLENRVLLTILPVIGSISPTSKAVSGPAFPLTVYGSSFAATSSILWNGTSLATTPEYDGGGNIAGLQTTVPATDLATAGTAQVTVSNPGTGGGISQPTAFTIVITTTSPGIIVAYFPDYEFSQHWGSINLTGLSQINYFSITVNSDGSLPTTSTSGDSLSQLSTIVSAAHATTPRVAASIVLDWHTNFLTIAQSATATTAFVNNLISFCTTYNLDGIDVDYEPGTLTSAQENSYGGLLAALHQQTSAHGLILSAAVQVSQMIIPKAYLSDIDRYNVMDYELDYNSSAPYSQSITYLNNWANYGVPKSELIMGVPFYAREGTSWSNTAAIKYSALLSDYAAVNNGAYPSPNLDSVTVSGTSYGYNGITTIQNKAQYVLGNGYGGMMIWELGQDHFTNNQYDAFSLLPAIKAAFNGSPVATLNAGILTVNGSIAGGATTLSESNGTFTVSAPAGSYAIASSTINSIFVTGTGGNDTINITSSLDKPVTFVGGGAGRDTLNVTAGTVTLQAPAAGYGLMTQALGTLSIAAGAKLVFASSASHTDRMLLMLNALTIAGVTNAWTGQLDLQWNDLLVHNGNVATLGNQVAKGFSTAGGYWNGQGIDSASSSINSSHMTALGINSGLTSFDGQSVATTDVLIKYTYYGDINLDGQVDGSDYTLIDNGYHKHLTGWFNGDFNYDNVIDGSDYTLIDNVYNMQSSILASLVAPTALIAKNSDSKAAVPSVFSQLPIESRATNAQDDWKAKHHLLSSDVTDRADATQSP